MEVSPVVTIIYQKLLTELKHVGSFEVEEKKSSIHLKNRAAFAGLHPRKDYLYIEIVSDSPIKNERVFRTEQVSKSRYHNTVKLEAVEDVDSELLTWVKDAYLLMA